ncbi:MAG: APC family permease [Acidiferrobacter sp.]
MADAAPPVPPPSLEKNALGFWGLVSQSISGMAPTCDVVAFMTAGAAFALSALPLSYLLAFLLMLVEINTLYHLSKHHLSAAGYAGYTALGLGERWGALAGILVIAYQVVSIAGIPLYIGGVFLPAVLLMVGLRLPTHLWWISFLFFVGVPMLLGVLGIRLSIRFVMATALTEVVFLVISSIIIIARTHTAAPWRPFTLPVGPTTAGGLHDIALGMIFAITSFIGIGSHAPLGEEVTPDRSGGKIIARAAIISLLFVGSALTISAYALTVGWGMNDMAAFSRNGAPGVVVFLRYFGTLGALALVVLALNSALADGVALLNSSARMVFATARRHYPETSLNTLSQRKSPQRAVLLLGGFAIAIGLVSGAALGPAQAFDFLTTTVLLWLAVVHVTLNVSVIRTYRHIHSHGHWVLHYVLPVLSSLMFIAIVYYSAWPLVFPIDYSALVFGVFTASVVALLWRDPRFRDNGAPPQGIA